MDDAVPHAAGTLVLMSYCDQAALLRPNGDWERIAVPGQEILATVAAGETIIERVEHRTYPEDGEVGLHVGLVVQHSAAINSEPQQPLSQHK